MTDDKGKAGQVGEIKKLSQSLARVDVNDMEGTRLTVLCVSNAREPTLLYTVLSSGQLGGRSAKDKEL